MQSASANYSQHGAEGVYRGSVLMSRGTVCPEAGAQVNSKQPSAYLSMMQVSMFCLSAIQSLTLCMPVNGDELLASPH